MTKKYLFLLFALCAPAVFHAGTQPFRSGVILAAELSSKKQSIRDFSEQEYPDLPENRVYASVTLKLFSGRILSRHDYSLHAFGKNYKCVALRVNGGAWKSAGSDVEYPGKNDKYSMLFILDSSVVGINQEEQLDLRCNYPPAKYADTSLVFTNRKQQDFTPASKIPAIGLLKSEK